MNGATLPRHALLDRIRRQHSRTLVLPPGRPGRANRASPLATVRASRASPLAVVRVSRVSLLAAVAGAPR